MSSAASAPSGPACSRTLGPRTSLLNVVALGRSTASSGPVAPPIGPFFSTLSILITVFPLFPSSPPWTGAIGCTQPIAHSRSLPLDATAASRQPRSACAPAASYLYTVFPSTSIETADATDASPVTTTGKHCPAPGSLRPFDASRPTPAQQLSLQQERWLLPQPSATVTSKLHTVRASRASTCAPGASPVGDVGHSAGHTGLPPSAAGALGATPDGDVSPRAGHAGSPHSAAGALGATQCVDLSITRLSADDALGLRIANLPSGQDVIITSIDASSPASSTALAPGDVIRAVDGHACNSSQQCASIAGSSRSTVVSLTACREPYPPASPPLATTTRTPAMGVAGDQRSSWSSIVLTLLAAITIVSDWSLETNSQHRLLPLDDQANLAVATRCNRLGRLLQICSLLYLCWTYYLPAVARIADLSWWVWSLRPRSTGDLVGLSIGGCYVVVAKYAGRAWESSACEQGGADAAATFTSSQAASPSTAPPSPAPLAPLSVPPVVAVAAAMPISPQAAAPSAALPSLAPLPPTPAPPRIPPSDLCSSPLALSHTPPPPQQLPVAPQLTSPSVPLATVTSADRWASVRATWAARARQLEAAVQQSNGVTWPAGLPEDEAEDAVLAELAPLQLLLEKGIGASPEECLDSLLRGLTLQWDSSGNGCITDANEAWAVAQQPQFGCSRTRTNEQGGANTGVAFSSSSTMPTTPPVALPPTESPQPEQPRPEQPPLPPRP